MTPVVLVALLRVLTLIVLASIARIGVTRAEDVEPDNRLRDRGTGVVTSVGGAYVRTGELLAQSWVAYAADRDNQYDPSEFGFPSPIEYIGHYRAHEANAWIAYGLRDDVSFEFQVAATRASLKTSPTDATGMPAAVRESGLGDVRGRLNWRILAESERRPELYTFATVLVPHDKTQVLTGTNNWLLNLGIGAIRGYSWGTLTLRSSMEFDLSSASVGDWGEVTLEYFKRLSPRVSILSALTLLQGDEGSISGELQWQPNRKIVLKLGGAQALTASGLDWSAQAGILFKFDGS